MKSLSFKLLSKTNLSMVEEKRYIFTSILILDSSVGVGEEIEIMLTAQAYEIAEDSIASLLLVEVWHVLIAKGLYRTTFDDGAELLFLQHFYRKPELLSLQEIRDDTFKAETRGILSCNWTISSEETLESSLIFFKNLFELLIRNLLLRSNL